MDYKEIKDLMRFFDKSGVNELEIEEGETRIYMSKTSPDAGYAQPMMMPQMQMPQMPMNMAQAAPVADNTPAASSADTSASDKTIDSPMIGTFYEAPTPGAAAFVKAGDIVEKGQTLCIIEAMKIMNTIEAEFKCKILKVLIENGKPVEYNQPIFVVDPL